MLWEKRQKPLRWCTVWYFPGAYTLLVSVLIFGLALVLAETGNTTAAAIILFVLELYPLYLQIQYTMDYVNNRVVGWTSVIAFFDIFVAMGVTFAGVWFGIFLLDPAQFVFLSPAEMSQYRRFISFVFAAFGMLSTAGFAIVIPRGVFSELWGVIGLFTSIWWLVMLFGGGIQARLQLQPRVVSVSDKH